MKYRVRAGSGWDLKSEYPLSKLENAFTDMSRDIYELRNSNMSCDLQQMKNRLNSNLRKMKEALDEIDENDEMEECE